MKAACAQVIAIGLLTALAGASVRAAELAEPVPAGAYSVDPAHASLLFRVNHLGFSMYTARFKNFDADLQFDPANLEASRVRVTVESASIETDFPSALKFDFNAELREPAWLHAAEHPQMVFESMRVVATGNGSFRIEGELTLRGITKPMILAARYNGGYAGHPLDPNARIGFSARGTLKRSDFGISVGIPAPGSTMGVSDEVEVIIEAEFIEPPQKKEVAP